MHAVTILPAVAFGMGLVELSCAFSRTALQSIYLMREARRDQRIAKKSDRKYDKRRLIAKEAM